LIEKSIITIIIQRELGDEQYSTGEKRQQKTIEFIKLLGENDSPGVLLVKNIF